MYIHIYITYYTIGNIILPLQSKAWNVDRRTTYFILVVWLVSMHRIIYLFCTSTYKKIHQPTSYNNYYAYFLILGTFQVQNDSNNDNVCFMAAAIIIIITMDFCSVCATCRYNGTYIIHRIYTYTLCCKILFYKVFKCTSEIFSLRSYIVCLLVVVVKFPYTDS